MFSQCPKYDLGKTIPMHEGFELGFQGGCDPLHYPTMGPNQDAPCSYYQYAKLGLL